MEQTDCAFGIDIINQVEQKIAVIRIPIIRCNVSCEDSCPYHILPLKY